MGIPTISPEAEFLHDFLAIDSRFSRFKTSYGHDTSSPVKIQYQKILEHLDTDLKQSPPPKKQFQKIKKTGSTVLQLVISHQDFIGFLADSDDMIKHDQTHPVGKYA